MKKNWIACVAAVVFLLFALVGGLVNGYSYDSDNMTASSYTINATVDKAGNLTINERISVDFDQGMSVIFRDIAYGKNNAGYKGNVSAFDYTSVGVKVYNSANSLIYDSNNAASYSGVDVGYSWKKDHDELGDLITCPSSYGTECESIFVRVRGGTYPTTTYEYTYTILDAVTVFDDIAELNWKFGVSNASFRINNANVTLTYPTVSSLDDVTFYGHSSTNGKLDALTTSSATFSTKRIKPNETLEARILLPTAIFSEASGSNRINADYLETVLYTERNIAKSDTLDVFIYWLGIALIVLVLAGGALAFVYIYRKFDKELTPDFDGQYFREIPGDYSPAEMSYLYNFGDLGKNDVSATLLDLIVRGYVEVDTMGQSVIDPKADYRLSLTNKSQDNLKSHEKNLIQWFFTTIGQDGTSVTLNELEKYPKKQANAVKYMSCNNNWIIAAKNAGNSHEFFDRAAEKSRSTHGWIPGIFAFVAIAALVCNLTMTNDYHSLAWLAAVAGGIAIIMYSYMLHIKRRSQGGNNDYARWRALRNYLVDFGKFDDDGIPSLILWEKYLVYATSFGIADLVEKQMRFKFKKLNIPEESYSNMSVFRYPYFYHSFYYRTSMMATMARTTMAAEAGKSIGGGAGRGGSGGFGGGSSFGGGGGGFRGR